ncbi:MAG TPA: LysR family transcriptional regulator [Geminicoccus sp.]|uniref:LysR family transcriptional regulator n=1 Tax=Geminicoccus sp. TaxID=2024832 RepID=UPI002B5E23BD|nr:LysR family transcriptional regulator [Geminicoccus sp.]HWL69338.1 LysR family transcriptional regulator [Geminicoccus sp.]
MQLRHLAYFASLGRELHFGRAAAACNITQSTLSAAIRQLEEEVGAPLVERDRRFRDFTPEGRVLLGWARRMLAERDLLGQELGALREGLTGHLRIGAIPMALPIVGMVTTPLLEAYPGVRMTVTSRTSTEIQRGLDEFHLEAGLTYLDNEPLHGLRAVPLYRERYLLVTPKDGPFAGRSEAAWSELAALPLCLLTPDMQNRRILNGIFTEMGLTPAPRLETNSVMALYSQMRAGSWSSVLPHSFLWVAGIPPGMIALPLARPDRSHMIGLVLRDQSPIPPLVDALEKAASGLRLQDMIERLEADDRE